MDHVFVGEKVESEGVGQETDETQASVDYAYLKIGRERYAAKVGDVHCSLFFRETKFLKVKYEILLVGFNVFFSIMINKNLKNRNQ